jgi:phosphoserine phosphatase
VGQEEEVAAITRAGIDGRIDWEDGFRKRAEVLRGLPQAQILRAARALRPMPGARAFVDWLRGQSHKVVLVTGGPREVAESALALFDADSAYSNEFHYEDGVFTGAVTIRVSPQRKGEIVRELATKWGIDKQNILAVGDGVMDLPLLTEAGIRLAINSQGKLKEHVDFEASDFHEAQRWLLGRTPQTVPKFGPNETRPSGGPRASRYPPVR